MAELQIALKEIDVLKTHTLKVGLQLPELVEKQNLVRPKTDSKMPDILEKKEGISSKISRTTFGSFSSNLPRTQSQRTVSQRSVSSLGRRPTSASLIMRPASQQYLRRHVTPTMYRPLSYHKLK
jgi:hypothetical protein